MRGDKFVPLRVEMATPVSQNWKLQMWVVRITLYSHSVSVMPTQIQFPSEKVKRSLQPPHIWSTEGARTQYLASAA